MISIENTIDGRMTPPVSGDYLDNVNPATGKVYSRVPKSGVEDAERAIAAARAAFPAWSQTPVEERIKKLRRLASMIRERESELVRAESIDNGKPVSLAAKVDIPRASKNLEFFCDGMAHFSSELYPMDDYALNYTLRRPLGVVTCISPWNLPLYLLTWKVAPALVTGNTVVAKPSEVTPMTAWIFGQMCIEAELPPGVLNILHGTGPDVGETISTHPDVKAVSFTGSTATGKTITSLASPLFKKVSLEMGGKNPNIVFADCDFEAALKTSILAAFSNQGQICLCGSRILVEKSLYNKFRDALVERAQKIRIGNPLDEKTQLGAVVSKAHYQKILSCIERAKEEGGRILCGGGAAELGGENAGGYFIHPTLIEGLDVHCRTNQEEIFGPVAALIPFEGEEQAVEYANATNYGLSASLWTGDVGRAHRMADKIQSGAVWVNSWMLRDLRIPFGGMKNSGIGREGGFDSLKFFTEVKNICVKVK